MRHLYYRIGHDGQWEWAIRTDDGVLVDRGRTATKAGLRYAAAVNGCSAATLEKPAPREYVWWAVLLNAISLFVGAEARRQWRRQLAAEERFYVAGAELAMWIVLAVLVGSLWGIYELY